MPVQTAERSFQLVAALLEESEHPLLVADRSGQLLYANTFARETFGLPGAWGEAEMAIMHKMLGPQLDKVVLDLENGDSDAGLDLKYDGSCVHARVRWLPEADWLLVQPFPGNRRQESDTETPAFVQAELPDAAIEGRTPVGATGIENPSPENGDLICESLGDGLYFLASTPQMMKIRKQAIRVAPVNVPVLISGESGSGKEVIARIIHQHQKGRKGPLIKVNCAALPAELLESELFGYEQGAFTGAVRAKPGQFELADHGTILLDEIAEMSTHLQSKLLHVLQDGLFSRLGSRHMVQVDVRVIAATNVDVREAIRQGRFREDLYYRLNVVPCHLPPLRERIDEIPLLFQLFLDRYSRQFGKQVAPPGLALREAARCYAWPGNVRELENFVKRYVIVADEQESLHELMEMEASHGKDFQMNSNGHKTQTLKSLVRGLKDNVEIEAIADALKQTNWRRKDAARILGISYKALLYKMRQFGFTPGKSSGHSHLKTVI